jgi:hypothetical protein
MGVNFPSTRLDLCDTAYDKVAHFGIVPGTWHADYNTRDKYGRSTRRQGKSVRFETDQKAGYKGRRGQIVEIRLARVNGERHAGKEENTPCA